MGDVRYTLDYLPHHQKSRLTIFREIISYDLPSDEAEAWRYAQDTADTTGNVTVLVRMWGEGNADERENVGVFHPREVGSEE